MQHPGTTILCFRRQPLPLTACVALLCTAAQIPAFAELPPPPKQITTSDWSILQREGTSALEAGQFYLAEPLLAQALYEAEKFGPKDERLAKSLSELGRLYAIRGKFSDAEHFYERELAVKEAAFGADDSRVVAVAGALIKFYLEHGTASKADHLTRVVLDFVEGRLDEQHAGTRAAQVRPKGQPGAPLEGYLGEAAPHMRGDILEWAYTCDSIGTAYRTHENYDLAERFYRAALNLKETILANGHLSLAISYDYLGMVYLGKQQYGDAEFYFKDALATTEKTLPSDSPEVYTRLDRLAKCLTRAGKTAQAADLYRQSLTFWEKSPCKRDEEARALYSLGSLCIQDKKYAEAAPMLQRALELAEPFYGPDQIALVPYLQQYAYALYYLNRMPEVQQLRARADAIKGVADDNLGVASNDQSVPATHRN